MDSNSVHIAVPCYDGRIFPRFDGASTFCFFEVDQDTGAHTLKEQEMCPEKDEVCDWLARHRVEGVICSGIQRNYQVKLDRLGIWLCWGISGPISQAIKQWLQHQTPQELATKA
ncbi:MAG: NifB/NifX family molybdenum-iron cluster-binding protein [Thermodesulfobacteriota bacterium]